MIQNYINHAVKVCVCLSLALLGVSLALNGSEKEMTTMVNFFNMGSAISANGFGRLFGALMLLAAALVLCSKKQKLSMLSFGLILLVAALPLLTLLDSSRYIESLGGFPILGSGQGVIKYAALIPLALTLFFASRFSLVQLAWFNYLPVAMVLMWIGGLKFYEFEAKGIVSLVSTSPFMSWLYELFSVQWASNLIGSYDILFAVLLGVGLTIRRYKLLIIAMLGCGAVFVMTQTFLITAQGAFSAQTVLAGLGQFVIKDLWFIANLLVILKFTLQLYSTSNNGD
ncbi:DUF417 family protein [Pseudoalteromonas sp. JBTF-M23]|uniref:DUF417 family protein n=1 Tax=Pseudoalteromonas caenipelagi TaxID=2726988 RepID=A0A849VG33_9GAMM|nr:DUF417 family protein [Pseudoalteromonas caenipelagi]NOU52236.1 DUF417 family protein [Pseudoalteromonas caenipelagi]